MESDSGRSYDGEPALFCRLLGDEGSRFAAVPTWMLDAAQCAQMVESDMPQVSWQSLRELRLLLNTAAAASRGTVLQHRHFPHVQGDADAAASTEAMAGTAGFVPGAPAENDLDDLTHPSATGGQAITRSNAQAAPASARCNRGREGGVP